ncbi:hypothetical protein Rs2_09557 [Raphanus sativus]|nr:hypothetical protein Rs2_09557 [Raphanus sativus]
MYKIPNVRFKICENSETLSPRKSLLSCPLLQSAWFIGSDVRRARERRGRRRRRPSVPCSCFPFATLRFLCLSADITRIWGWVSCRRLHCSRGGCLRCGLCNFWILVEVVKISSGSSGRLWPDGRLLVEQRHLVLSSRGSLTSSSVWKRPVWILASLFGLLYFCWRHRLEGFTSELWVFGSRSPQVSSRFSGVIDWLGVNTWSCSLPGVVFVAFFAGCGGVLVWWWQQNRPVFLQVGSVAAVAGTCPVWDLVSSAVCVAYEPGFSDVYKASCGKYLKSFPISRLTLHGH